MSKQTKLAAFLTLSLFILSLFFAAPAQAYDTEADTGNLLLTELDFAQAIKDNKYLLVNFHALWCRYSKKLKPEWNALSDPLKSLDVKLAKVEAYDEKKLAEQYEIDGFPTIKFFIDGTPSDYTGERTQSHILEFVNRKLERPLSQLVAKSDLDAKLKEYEWVAVYIGNDNSDVKKVASQKQEIFFAYSSNDDIRKGANNGQLVLYNNITGDSKTWDPQATPSLALADFLDQNKFGDVAKFSAGTAEEIFLKEDPAIILIRDASPQSDTAEKNFREARSQSELKGVFMSVANTNDEISKLLAQNLGVSTSDLPAVVIVRADRERIRKYKLSGEITAASVVQFYGNHKTQRIYLSEEVPKENKDLVKKVVGKTFKEMVLDQSKDVLLLIWAPWCGHCRAMMPVYDNVARKTREVQNFLVAKIDASVNDLEEFGLDIVEYPTILLFRREQKDDPVEFKGERNEYVFNEFIRSHAAVDLSRMKGPNPFDKNEL